MGAKVSNLKRGLRTSLKQVSGFIVLIFLMKKEKEKWMKAKYYIVEYVLSKSFT